MPTLFNMVSWNIKQFSKRRGRKRLAFLQDLEVKTWVADLLVDQLANVAGLMEVTTRSGEYAVREVVNSMNGIAGQIGGGVTSLYDYVVSDRNATGKTASRADRYGVIFTTKAATLQFQPATSDPCPLVAVSVEDAALGGSVAKKVKWTDRQPYCWNVSTGAVMVTVVIWHAPQPGNTLGEETIDEFSQLFSEFGLFPYNTGKYVLAGDFNLNTKNQTSFYPLTKLGFAPVFAGQQTTLTTLKAFIQNNKDQFVQAGDYDEAFLARAYDDIFVKGVTYMDEIRPLVPFWVLTQILSTKTVTLTTKVPTYPAAAHKTALAISDHLPLSVTIATIGTTGSIDLAQLPAYVRVEAPEEEAQP